MRYVDEMEDSLMDVEVVADSFADKKSLKQISLPNDIRIIRIKRGSTYVNAIGDTILHAHDRLLLLAHEVENVELVRQIFEEKNAV